MIDPLFPLAGGEIDVYAWIEEEWVVTATLPVDGRGSIDLSTYEHVPEQNLWGRLRSANYVAADVVLGPKGLADEVALERGSKVNVTVVGPRGVDVANLGVSVSARSARGESGGVIVCHTDASGHGLAVVRPLREEELCWTFAVVEEGWHSERVDLVVREAGSEFDVRLRAEPVARDTIAFMVTDDRGEAIGNTDVNVRQLRNPHGSGLPARTWATRTDETGYFEVGVDVDGPPYFRVSAQFHEDAELEAAAGDVVPVTLIRFALLDVTLRDPQIGAVEPVSGSATLMLASGERSFSRRNGAFGILSGPRQLIVATSRSDGSAVFPTVFQADLQPGEHGSVTVDLFPTRVQGTVRDESGRPVVAATVIVGSFQPLPEWCPGPSQATCRLVTDETGRFEFRSVPEGRCTLTVIRTGFDTHTTNLALAGDGVSDLRIQLERDE